MCSSPPCGTYLLVQNEILRNSRNTPESETKRRVLQRNVEKIKQPLLSFSHKHLMCNKASLNTTLYIPLFLSLCYLNESSLSLLIFFFSTKDFDFCYCFQKYLNFNLLSFCQKKSQKIITIRDHLVNGHQAKSVDLVAETIWFFKYSRRCLHQSEGNRMIDRRSPYHLLRIRPCK